MGGAGALGCLVHVIWWRGVNVDCRVREIVHASEIVFEFLLVSGVCCSWTTNALPQ